MAEAAERLGYGFISVNDHIVVPRDIASRYPYSESGEWAARTAGECLDQLATLAFLAARTERLRLLTSVMVVPQRHPVLTAKMLATIDVLSAGRLIVGCGVGWLKEEFEAVGAPDFAERGRVTDEYLDAFKVLWTEDATGLSAASMCSSTTSCSRPSPCRSRTRRSGSAARASSPCKRAVRVGDGWYPASNNPQNRLDTAARLGAAVQQLRRICEAAGRDPASLDIAYIALSPVDWTAQKAGDGERRIFTGDRAAMAADVAALEQAGVRHVCLTLPDRRARRDPGAHRALRPECCWT